MPPPDRVRHAPMPRRASGVGLLAALWAAGCLMPPPLTPLEERDNQPPRIDKANLTPAPSEGPRLMTTQCAGYSFFAGLTDPDADDTLYWRVFLDYHQQQPGALLATEVRDSKPGALIDFTVTPQDSRFLHFGRLAGLHTVELFISDRPFDETPRQPYARRVGEAGLTDSFVWAVDINESEPCAGAEVAP